MRTESEVTEKLNQIEIALSDHDNSGFDGLVAQVRIRSMRDTLRWVLHGSKESAMNENNMS